MSQPVRKLYILVDQNLSPSQRAVQAAHAVAEYLLTHRDTEWDNGTLVLLKVPDLEPWLKHADAIFREPDLDNRITAIAAYDISEIAKGLTLL